MSGWSRKGYVIAVPISVLGHTGHNSITVLFTKGLEIQSSSIQCEFHALFSIKTHSKHNQGLCGW